MLITTGSNAPTNTSNSCTVFSVSYVYFCCIRQCTDFTFMCYGCADPSWSYGQPQWTCLRIQSLYPTVQGQWCDAKEVVQKAQEQMAWLNCQFVARASYCLTSVILQNMRRLVVHALTGCDTTSAIFGQSKVATFSKTVSCSDTLLLTDITASCTASQESCSSWHISFSWYFMVGTPWDAQGTWRKPGCPQHNWKSCYPPKALHITIA